MIMSFRMASTPDVFTSAHASRAAEGRGAARGGTWGLYPSREGHGEPKVFPATSGATEWEWKAGPRWGNHSPGTGVTFTPTLLLNLLLDPFASSLCRTAEWPSGGPAWVKLLPYMATCTKA